MAPRKPVSNESRSELETPKSVRLYFDGEPESPAERMAAIRQLRRGQILNLLLKEGTVSRVDISRALGFNLRTVSLLVSDMIKDGVIIEKPAQASATMGRRPLPLELNPSAASVLAIEVDRDFTYFALLDLMGNFQVRAERPSDFKSKPEEQAEWLVNATREFLKDNHKGLPPLAGVGFSFDGFVFRQHAAHTHATITEPIRLALQEALNVPVSSDTNSRLITVAEQRFGCAKDSRNIISINIGDGLSLGCMVDGKMLTGSRGIAGELGHIPLGEPGLACYCGGHGCLENVVSGSGLRRLADKAGVKIKSENVFEEFIRRSAAGEKGPSEIMAQFWHHLALGINLGVNLYDPEIIVISGPAAPTLAAASAELQPYVHALGVPFILEGVKLRFSELGGNAVLLGSGGQVLNSIYSAAHVTAESLL